MMENIAATCRALACDVRLVALHHLRFGAELSAGELAARIGLPLDWLSSHLARLVALRLVSRRRSGGRVLLRLAVSPSPEARFDPLPAVCRALTEPQWATLGWNEEELLHLTSPVVNSLRPPSRRVLDVVFDAATAFGNVRRLQILRLLMQESPRTAAAIVGGLGMSSAACRRHVDKLLRRGCLRQAGTGAWSQSESGKTPFHETLLREVRNELGRSPMSDLINSEIHPATSLTPRPETALPAARGTPTRPRRIEPWRRR
jgi:DNA-binding transcriptional ArsR family regulator